MKKILTIALCVILTLSLFSGCAKTDPEEVTPPTNSEKVYTLLDPDDVVMTVEGKDIYWKDYFYFLNYYITLIDEYFYAVKTTEGYSEYPSTWSALVEPGRTFIDYAIDNATSGAVYNPAIEKAAKELGISLDSDEMHAYIEKEWLLSVDSYGGEEAFLEFLSGTYSSKEFYEYLIKCEWLTQACYNELYGENAEKLSDSDIADYIKLDGYMMAKHILISTRDDNDKPLSDEEKTEVHALMEGVLEQLNNYEGDDFDAFFDSLMWTHTEDLGGLNLYPEGYLFQSGEMVIAFENAWKELKDGEYSGLVETDFGYHIVYRLPINYDEIPYKHADKKQAGDNSYTLRNMSATGMFNSIIAGWKDNVTRSFSEKYNSLDLAAVLGE